MGVPTSVVSEQEWNREREALLLKEKELTRARDALAAERRLLPMVRVEKEYRFEGPEGEVGLLDLFEGRRQLIVYRFYLDPGMEIASYPEDGCPGCTMFADNLPKLTHLNARDTTIVFVSAGSQEAIRNYRARMGWDDWPWYTTADDFSEDFDVGENFGINVFFRDGAQIYRTYFTTSRGAEELSSIWALLDITPFGPRRRGRTPPRAFRRTEPARGYAGAASTAPKIYPGEGRAHDASADGQRSHRSRRPPGCQSVLRRLRPGATEQRI